MSTTTIKTPWNEYNFTRTNNDVNGNPRYIVHYLALGLKSCASNDLTRRAGLSLYCGKGYGGGFVFQSYNLQTTAEFFEDLGLCRVAPKPRKTNSKEVTQAVQKHILKIMNTSEYPGHDGSDKKSLEIVLTAFANQYLYPSNIKRYGSYQKCFTEWCKGLPSVLDVEYRTDGVLKLMKSWGLPQPKGKDDSDSFELYLNLVYMNITRMAKDHKIDYMWILQKNLSTAN